MADEPRHPLLVDTSALVAVANTELWDLVADSLTITTTNVCAHELRNHVEEHAYPPEGSRAWYLKRGSERTLACIDESTAFSCVTVVPRPHGPDAGEESLKRELVDHPDAYQVVVLLDTAARRSIRRLVEDRGYDVDVVGPPYLLYVLLDNGLVSKAEFCEAAAEMIHTEGWTGYEVVKSAWEGIPVDCTEVLGEGSDVLPP